ncbi:MAG: PfkB family carbohydrate kinase [Nitrospirota bacterium]
MKSVIYDVCVIGHITKDIIRIGNIRKELPGGSAYYVSIALKSLGLKPFVVTRLHKNDKYLLEDLKKNDITVFLGKSERTTIFENIYKGDLRIQRVMSVASPFTIKDLPDITPRIFYIGSLTRGDIPTDMLDFLREYKIALDVQGFLRKIDGNIVKMEDWEDKEVLSYVDILHADEMEAKILSGEGDIKKAAKKLSQFGPKEVVITLGKSGSLIYAKEELFSIPSFETSIVDPTGCGDTYMAGYIYKRLTSEDFYKIGKFSSAIASLKLKRFGTFTGNEKDVKTLILAKVRSPLRQSPARVSQKQHV